MQTNHNDYICPTRMKDSTEHTLHKLALAQWTVIETHTPHIYILCTHIRRHMCTTYSAQCSAETTSKTCNMNDDHINYRRALHWCGWNNDCICNRVIFTSVLSLCLSRWVSLHDMKMVLKKGLKLGQSLMGWRIAWQPLRVAYVENKNIMNTFV